MLRRRVGSLRGGNGSAIADEQRADTADAAASELGSLLLDVPIALDRVAEVRKVLGGGRWGWGRVVRCLHQALVSALQHTFDTLDVPRADYAIPATACQVRSIRRPGKGFHPLRLPLQDDQGGVDGHRIEHGPESTLAS